MKKLLSLFLALITVFACASGCAQNDGIDISKAPDYSDAQGEFITYAYHSPIPEAYFYGPDGEIIAGDGSDMRNAKTYKEYLDCGLNTMFIQANDPYYGPFEGSDLQNNMKLCVEVGISRIILCDMRLLNLSMQEFEIYGTPDSDNAKQLSFFKTVYGDTNAHEFSDLVTYVKNCMKDYIAVEPFFGVMLKDEPHYTLINQVADTYKAIKQAFPLAKAELEAEGKTVAVNDVYVQANMLPYYTTVGSFVNLEEYNKLPADQKKPKAQIYREYIAAYLERSGADNILTDTYCIKQKGVGDTAEYYIIDEHFSGLQILAELANEYNCTLGGISASTALTKDLAHNDISLKAPNKSEMYYQVNSYMMFGFSSYSYYTYWSKTPDAAYRVDGTSFINRDGSKGALYDVMTDIHKEMQQFAPMLLQFRYKGIKTYQSRVTSNSTSFLADVVQSESFSVLKDVTIGDDSVAVVTELFDDDKNVYMYALMNPQAPSNAIYGDIGLSATLDFGTQYSAVEISYRGEITYLPLKDGKITLDLSAGNAMYIMPF